MGELIHRWRSIVPLRVVASGSLPQFDPDARPLTSPAAGPEHASLPRRHTQDTGPRPIGPFQGTRSYPHPAPEWLRSMRLWVVAAPPEERLIRVQSNRRRIRLQTRFETMESCFPKIDSGSRADAIGFGDRNGWASVPVWRGTGCAARHWHGV
ncbi:hypothetical protein MESS4_830257 [Mesorhizobium sp. STM 4661]|nr:hypothetical protein MESS4_830257 [Mesorhizobium sp. STM 4661]